MKKYFASIILTLYITFFMTVSGMASELYFIKNGNKAQILPVIQNSFSSSGYTIKNNDPVYGVKGSFSVVTLLEQTSSGSYCFIDNTIDSDLTNKIKSSVKSLGYSYKKMNNDTLAMSYTQTITALKNSLSTQTKKYDFEVKTAQAAYNNENITQTQEEDGDVWTGYIAQIPSGTTFDVYLQSTINTATAQEGDEVIGILTKNWTYKGYVVAEQGSKIVGTVTKANSAGMAQRDGKVKFNFTQLQTVDGKVYPINTEVIEFKVDSDGKLKSNVGKIVGGVAVGSLLGVLFGAIEGGDNSIGKGAAWGAGIGAAWGAGSAVLEQGSDAEIPMYTEMEIKLTAPLKMVLSK